MQKIKGTNLWSASLQKLEKEKFNSDHVQTLLKLGFRIKGRKIIPPENLLVPLEMYNRRVSKMIEDGQLKNSEAIYASIEFESVERNGELRNFRPGIDEIPNAHHWKLSELTGLFHHEWVSLVAEGNMPVGLAALYYLHDLAHLTENLRVDPQTQRPEFMIAVRTIYKEQKKDLNKNHWDSSEHNHPIPKRSFQILESMSLGRLSSETRLRALRPELFDNQTSLKELKDSLQSLSFEELDARLNDWIANESQFVLRQGAVERDLVHQKFKHFLDIVNYISNVLPHSLSQSAIPAVYNTSRDEHLIGYLRNAQLILAFILRTEKLLDPINESPPSYHINTLTDLRKSLDMNKTELEKVKSYIADLLARFEMGLVKSVELQLTPDQLVYDLAGAHVKPDSPSIEWLRSYLDPSGRRYSLFIGDR